jgi:hypothetical protein
LFYSCPGLFGKSDNFDIYQVIPSYNKTKNSTVELYSSISNLENFGSINVLKECGTGFLAVGEFNEIGNKKSKGVSFWNGKKKNTKKKLIIK